jgi:hypothetical protein
MAHAGNARQLAPAFAGDAAECEGYGPRAKL